MTGVGNTGELSENIQELMNLGVGTDSRMVQPQSPLPLSHHDTRCPDHRAISKGRVILPLDGPDL